MEYQALLAPTKHNESTKPLRVDWVVWNRLLRAAMAHGGLELECWSASEAAQFARALTAALDAPPPPAASPTRFAVFWTTPVNHRELLRDPSVEPTVRAVIALFGKGGVRVERVLASAHRAYSRA